MEFLRPTSWADPLALKAEHPTALPIAGGTDVMVELNFDLRRPSALLDLGRSGNLPSGGSRAGWCGSAPPCPTPSSSTNWPGHCPALARAAGTVGSPQIRSRGSVGGNLGAA